MASGVSKLKEEVKQNLRALLESATHGVFLNELGKEYKGVLGTELPYRKLGYSSVQDLISDLPDTLVITPSRRGPMVACVSNQKTEHLERMVRTQKTNSSARYGHVPKTMPVKLTPEKPRPRNPGDIPPLMGERPPIRPPYWHPQHQPIMPHHYQPANICGGGYPALVGPPYRNPAPYPHYVPMPMAMGPTYPHYPVHGGPRPVFFRPPATQLPKVMQEHMQSLLEMFPNGVTERRFRDLFISAFNYEIFPDTYGFQNLLEALGSLPSVASLRNMGDRVLIYPAKHRQSVAQKEQPSPARDARASSSSASWQQSRRMPSNDLRAAPGTSEKDTSETENGSQARARSGLVDVAVDATSREPELPSVSGRNHSPTKTVSRPDREETTAVHSSLKSSSPKCIRNSPSQAKSYSAINKQNVSSLPSHSDASSFSEERPNTKPKQSASYDDNEQSAVDPHEQTSTDERLGEHIGERMKATFRQILDANPNGIWASELIKLYKEQSGCRLDFREFGFYSIHELALSIPEVFSIKKSKKMGDWLLMPRESSTNDSGMDSSSQQSKSNEMLKNDDRDNPRISLSQALKKKMLQVICSCQNGTVLSDFETIYKRLHNEDFVLNYSDKYYTAEAVFLALPNLFVVDYVNEKKIIIRATLEGKSLLRQKIEIAEPLQTKAPCYPDDAVIKTPDFRIQTLPADLTRKTYIELFVSYVVHPGQFWIRLRETSAMLDTLMSQMKMFYHNPALSRDYVMPDNLITQNRMCAALFPADENWHRAIITSIQGEETVQVFYVDYGNLGKVHRSKIRFLKKQFMALPFQALMAKLTRIIPAKRESWPDAAVKRFIALCLDKPLVALVSSHEASLLSLCLCDTTGDDDIHINTTLVSEGLAAFDSVVENKPFNSPSMGKTLDNGSKYSYQNSGLFAGASCSHSTSPGHSFTGHSRESASLSSSLIESARNIRLDGDSLNIIPTRLMNDEFHIVRLDGNMYVPTFEISSLFWKRDILTEMVRLAKVPVSFLAVEKELRPVVFAELRRLCTKDSWDVKEILLCPLSRVPDILSAIEPAYKELHRLFLDLVKLHKL